MGLCGMKMTVHIKYFVQSLAYIKCSKSLFYYYYVNWEQITKYLECYVKAVEGKLEWGKPNARRLGALTTQAGMMIGNKGVTVETQRTGWLQNSSLVWKCLDLVA